MKLIAIITIVLQGILMATTVTHIEQNGVYTPLIIESDHRLPIVSMQVVFLSSGSINDGKHAGVASLSAKLLGEGTSKLGSIAFANELENRAISLHIEAGKESFIFELNALKERFGAGIDLLTSLLIDPNLSKKSLEKVKTERLSQLERKKSDFDYVASIGLDELMYKGSPFELPNIGTTATVQEISAKHIKAFLKDLLVKENAVILFGGDITNDEAERYSKQILSALRSGKKRKLPHIEISPVSSIKEIKRDTEQAYIYFGSPFFMSATDDESYKATVASYILGGGGFGSRIMEEVRVKHGYAYSAYGRISLGLSNSRFKGYLQTELKNQEKALDLVRKVIKEFVAHGVTNDELESAKQFLLGAEPLRNETVSQRLSRSFNDFYRGKEMGWSKKQLDLIEKLTLDELNSFIKKHSEIEDLTIFILTK